MTTLFEIVEGWTGTIGPFTLKVNGVALDLTNLTLQIILRNSLGLVTPGGTITADPDQLNNRGQVSYTPVETDFVFVPSGNKVRQSYLIHWKVTDQAGRTVYFPNGEPDEISLYRE